MVFVLDNGTNGNCRTEGNKQSKAHKHYGGLLGCYCSAKTGYHGILYQALAIRILLCELRFTKALQTCAGCRGVKVANLCKLLNQHNDIAVQ